MSLYKIISAVSLPACEIITSMLFSGYRTQDTSSLSADVQQDYPDTDEEALITDLNEDEENLKAVLHLPMERYMK